MKSKTVNLDAVLAKELKNDEFRLAFEEHRFYLQMARLVSNLRARTGLSQVELAKKAGDNVGMLPPLIGPSDSCLLTSDSFYCTAIGTVLLLVSPATSSSRCVPESTSLLTRKLI